VPPRIIQHFFNSSEYGRKFGLKNCFEKFFKILLEKGLPKLTKNCLKKVLTKTFSNLIHRRKKDLIVKIVLH
jgi:hypothetical protein